MDPFQINAAYRQNELLDAMTAPDPSFTSAWTDDTPSADRIPTSRTPVLPSNSLYAYWISGPAAACAAPGTAMTANAVSTATMSRANLIWSLPV